jgi:hypothetical protein
MRTLSTQEDTISYTGFFFSPAFALWADGLRVIEGLYRTFNDYGVGLNDIKADVTPDSSSAGINVDLNDLGDYKLGFEQVEWTMGGISDENFARVPELLSRGEGWLRSVVPNFAFKLHEVNYYSHNLLSEGTSQDFLREFSNVDIPDVGTSLGNGLIFHWELPEDGWRMNLTIDHSNLHVGGLFLEQEIFAPSDKVDYETLIVSGRKLLQDALNKIGLEFEDEE